MRYVVYRRVSTADQGASGLGLEAQERDIRLFLDTYAEAGSTVIEAFTEVASGGDDDRPVLAKAIAMAKAQDGVLLVSKLDRLSRKVSKIAVLMDDNRLRLRVASMPHADKFQLHIYAALAEQEREFISRRTREALASAKARGVKLGGLRPGTAARNAAVKDAAAKRAERVRAIVLPLRERGATLRDIADALNGSNVPTPRGGLWHAGSVNRVLARLNA